MIKPLLFLLFLFSPLCAETGIASWYCVKCNRGTHTASGKVLKDNLLTAAHRTLPFGTKVRVINLKTKKSVVVTIIDRGPYIPGRIIDLTKAAFKKIKPIKAGLCKVKIEIIKKK